MHCGGRGLLAGVVSFALDFLLWVASGGGALPALAVREWCGLGFGANVCAVREPAK